MGGRNSHKKFLSHKTQQRQFSSRLLRVDTFESLFIQNVNNIETPT